MRNLPESWQGIEPCQVELPHRKPGQGPRVEGRTHDAAAVGHVVEEAPGRVAAVDVEDVGEPVFPFPLDRVVVGLKGIYWDLIKLELTICYV